MGKFDWFKKLSGENSKKPQQPQMPPPAWESQRYFGGELSGREILYVSLILAIGGGLIVLFMFTPVGLLFRGPSFQVHYSIGSFMNSFGVRDMIYQLTHPFEVQPTQAQTEHTNENEYLKSIAESLSLKGDVIPDKVEVKQTPFSVYLNVVNEGTDTVNRIWVLLVPKSDDDYSRESLGPGLHDASVDVGYVKRIGCDPQQICYGSCDAIGDLKLGDSEICNPREIDNMNGKFLFFELDNPLPAGSALSVPVTNIFVQYGGQDFKDKTVSIPFYARIYSFYVAASRLPVTFISYNYSTLLYRMNKFKYGTVPATALSGTAMRIDLDVGQQPLSSTTQRTVALISFKNRGAGKLYGSPMLILLLPKDTFSACTENYYSCDNEIGESLKMKLCSEDSVYYSTIGGFAHKEVDWICDSMDNKDRDFHICILDPSKAKEFQTYACTMDVHVDMKGSKRQTTYITAFAIYPYMYEVPLMVTAYEVGG